MPEAAQSLLLALVEEFSWLNQPSAWAGLFALVIMEVVLGVDNLVFIAILAGRAAPELRDRARLAGLGMALLLRVFLLLGMSLLLRLTHPFLGPFSARDILFILGGLFLLYKATSELHERLEAAPMGLGGAASASAAFWPVVLQIMLLDAVFSLDAVITAVSMVPHVSIMILAVSLAIGLMLLASGPLTRFVGAHPTVVVLCLSFLLLIGFSMVAEGFGIHVPKEYLYAAIGFSVLIEAFNQISTFNQVKRQAMRPMRARAAELILRLMGDRGRPAVEGGEGRTAAESIAGEEGSMVSGVLSLGERSLRSLMTPRNDIRWINIEAAPEKITRYMRAEPHGHYPLCRGRLDELLGLARGSDILEALRAGENPAACSALRQAVTAPESLDALRLLKLMRSSPGNVVIAVDEFGSVSGLITPVDIFEIIAGEFRYADETPDLRPAGDGSLLVRGGADLRLLEQHLNLDGLLPPDGAYGSVAGLLLDNFGHLPEAGESMEYKGLRFVVEKVSARRIEGARVIPLQAAQETDKG